MRKHYLDNIRWSVVVLVVLYHVLYMYNGEGIAGGLGKITELDVQHYDLFQYARSISSLRPGCGRSHVAADIRPEEYRRMLSGTLWHVDIEELVGGVFNIGDIEQVLVCREGNLGAVVHCHCRPHATAGIELQFFLRRHSDSKECAGCC